MLMGVQHSFTEMIFLLLLISTCPLSAISEEPQIRIRAPKESLDRIIQQIWDEFSSMVNTGRISIPDMVSGEELEIRNVQVSNLGGHVSIFFNPPSGFGLKLDGGHVRLAADILVCKRIIFLMCIPLGVTATVEGITLNISANLGIDGVNLSIDGFDCRTIIEHLHLEITGGLVGFIVNLFSSYIAHAQKPGLEIIACEEIRRFVDEHLESMVNSPMILTLSDGLEFDYGILEEPKITLEYIELNLRGRVFLRDSPETRSPYGSIPLPSDGHHGTEGIQIWMGETIFNDFFHFSHVLNISRYSIAQKIPLFGPDHPMGLGELGLVLGTSSPPYLFLPGNGVAWVDMAGIIFVYAHLHTTLPIFQVAATFQVDFLDLSIRNGRIFGRIRMRKQKMEILLPIQSRVKDFVETVVPVVTRPVSQMAINDRLARGIEIPSMDGIGKAEIAFLKRTVKLTLTPRIDISDILGIEDIESVEDDYFGS